MTNPFTLTDPMPPEDDDDVMSEFVESVSYAEDRPIRPWAEVPETGEEPDDESVEGDEDLEAIDE